MTNTTADLTEAREAAADAWLDVLNAEPGSREHDEAAERHAAAWATVRRLRDEVR